MNNISIYTKSGSRAATAYYRIYQYLNNIPGDFYYRKMLPDKLYQRIMPISTKNMALKISIFIYIYIRVLLQLLTDSLNRPKILIISRRFINRTLPWSYRYLLKRLHSFGTKIIWDFDDDILETKEISQAGCKFMSEISDHIIVASPTNRDIISDPNKCKVIILPTTDGDMYHLLSKKIEQTRLNVFLSEIRLIWVGTSVSLKYLKEICPALEKYGQLLKASQKKKLVLTIVCDKSLDYKSNDGLTIRNITWDRQIAIKELLESHIGLMPLEVSKFTKGKGGFKLIQYLSVGLPIIGSPVGINDTIITSEVGIKVDELTSYKWGEAIDTITINQDSWLRYSQNAIKQWCTKYNYRDHLLIWKNLLNANNEPEKIER